MHSEAHPGPKAATPATQALNESRRVDLDPADFERARRGLIAKHPGGVIGEGGAVVWDVSRHDFVRSTDVAPSTVNPNLWRQAQLNAIHGLFEVAPGVWQVRGYDISNVTFIAGDSGWIVIDPLTVEATARAALELANAQLGARPVTAVIYTHSHTDHFGGVLGVTTQADVDAGRCRIVAPDGFLREAVAENIIGGPAMGRRATYQFGVLLPPGPMGHVDCGLGTSIPMAASGLIAPTDNITTTGQELVLDGVRIVFQNTPEAEAPAEMNFFFPDKGWLCMAENCTHTMHNLVPVRGAQVRDALAWSKYIGEALELFGSSTTVLFTSHHWPRWGSDDIAQFLRLQRDLYRWMHDQTMRLANHGLTPLEIAEELRLPATFGAQSHTRGYYGDLVHNVKAVYQRYLSWYDGNPARLHQHPPVEAAKRYVRFMGGSASVISQAEQAFHDGDYRWVCEVVNHVVFAEPDNLAARALQADALEQLGYQAESATFRNSYLMAAQELRNGPPPRFAVRRRGLVEALTIELIFDALAIRLKSEELEGISVRTNWRFTDIGEDWIIGIDHGALHTYQGKHDPNAALSVTTTRAALLAVVQGDTTMMEAISTAQVAVEGDGTALMPLFGHLDVFETGFAIVEP